MADFRAWRDSMLIREAGVEPENQEPAEAPDYYPVDLPMDKYAEILERHVCVLKQDADRAHMLRRAAEDRCVALGIQIERLRNRTAWVAALLAIPCAVGLWRIVAVLADWWRG
jgi:hypothetical protein